MHDSSQLWAAEFAKLELLVAVILLEAVKLQHVELHLRLHNVLLRSLNRGFDRVSALKFNKKLIICRDANAKLFVLASRELIVL